MKKLLVIIPIYIYRVYLSTTKKQTIYRISETHTHTHTYFEPFIYLNKTRMFTRFKSFRLQQKKANILRLKRNLLSEFFVKMMEIRRTIYIFTFFLLTHHHSAC